jgi:hypothetical protein
MRTQAVPCLVTLVEIWGLQMIIVASALEREFE